MSKLKRRIGTFTVTKELYDEADFEKLSDFFSLLGFIPMRAEFIYADNRFELQGISKYFDYVKFDEIIPSYDIKVLVNDDNVLLGLEVEKF